MQLLSARCAGLDVHKKTIVACLMITLLNGQVHKEVRTFATTTAGLLAAFRLALQSAGDPRGHRKYRGVLATGLQHPGSHLHRHSRQRPTHQGGPWPQSAT